MIWNPATLVFNLLQSVDVISNEDLTYFVINGTSFLVLASTNLNGPNLILRFNGTGFQELERYYQHETYDFGLVSVNPNFNYLIEAKFDQPSLIRLWNGTTFNNTVQTLNTYGGTDIEPFVINSKYYFAVSNSFDYQDLGRNLTVDIYRFENLSVSAPFVLIQSIPAGVPFHSQAMLIGSDTFLAIAERGGPVYNRPSSIWRYDSVADQFVLFQTIMTEGAYEWKHFQLLGADYLALANSFADAGVGYEVSSMIYRWTGQEFAMMSTVQTFGATSWEHISINGVDYIFVVNGNNNVSPNVNSVVYRLSPR